MCDAGTEPLMARRRQAEEPGCGRTAGPGALRQGLRHCAHGTGVFGSVDA